MDALFAGADGAAIYLKTGHLIAAAQVCRDAPGNVRVSGVSTQEENLVGHS